MIPRRRVITPTDPHFASVVLLINPKRQGLGATDFRDFSKYKRALTYATDSAATAAFSTSNQKFYTQSIFNQESGPSGPTVSAASSSDFDIASGDFTIEWWYYPTSLTNSTYTAGTVFHRGDTTNRFNWVYAGGAQQFQWAIAGVVACPNAAHGMSANTAWYYWGIKRSGTTYSVWRDGSQLSSASGATAVDAANAFALFAHNTSFTNGATSGYLGGFRFTNGVARDLSVVPNRPFPER